MKRHDGLFESMDRKVDKVVMPVWQSVRNYVPFFAITLLSVLLAVFIVRMVYNKPDYTAAVITTDIKRINQILHNIDESCDILSFDHKKNHIDFLTVRSFIGSEVGGLNLARPEGWQGPYLDDNPTVQNILYQIIKIDEGVFVIPGDGVELPNGLVMGKDIEIRPETSLFAMMKEGGNLFYRGEPLAIKLEFRIGDWKGKLFSSQQIENVSKTLQEFNKAMPYAENKKGRFSGYKIELPRTVS